MGGTASPALSRKTRPMPPATESAVISGLGDGGAIDIKRPRKEIALAPTLQRIAAECGTTFFGLVKDYARCAFGPGRLTFDEYLALRLFDPRLYAEADKRAFVGLTRSRKIWITANFRVENFALVENKIAADALFAAYGFRTAPTLALFCNRIANQSSRLLQSEAELRDFLRNSD